MGDASARIAGLYGLPLERFTPERNALAAALRTEGDLEAAAEVKGLRKPSAAAWAVNQLVRAEPDLVEALLGAGGELRQAHRQAASGRGAAQLRAAAEAERAAVERLMARAPVVLGRTLSAGLAEAMRNTLHAASSDDLARGLVASGTLSTELRPIGLGPVPASLRRGGRSKDNDSAKGGGLERSGLPSAARKTRAAEARAAAAAARAEKERAAERARELKAAVADETAFGREVDAASRALQRAEEAYARASEAADAAAERAKDARKRLREARAGLVEAQRRRARLERD